MNQDWTGYISSFADKERIAALEEKVARIEEERDVWRGRYEAAETKLFQIGGIATSG